MWKVKLSSFRIYIYMIVIGIMLNKILSEETDYGSINNNNNNNEKHATLFDFSTINDLSEWVEESDTVRDVGKSKAVLTLQKTRRFQRAIFFTLLNPQPNGACFAGVKTPTMYDLSDYQSITLNVRGQGSNTGYKMIMQHKSRNDTQPTYEQMFDVPNDGEFYTIRLALDKFKPYFRGKLLNDTEPLDSSHITSIGLQIYGGVYLPEKQSGVSSLEIDWIRADI